MPGEIITAIGDFQSVLLLRVAAIRRDQEDGRDVLWNQRPRFIRQRAFPFLDRILVSRIEPAQLLLDRREASRTCFRRAVSAGDRISSVGSSQLLRKAKNW